MDQSYSESDVSLSPTQILERLHMLRQFQLMQQGKLQKQRLQYEESSRSSTITEIVSQFSNSTGFNTFRSLLESPRETSTDSTPRLQAGSKSKSPQVKPQDLIDGVSVLNLSQESEFIVNSPVSSRSKVSTTSTAPRINELALTKKHAVPSLAHKKQISLDDMPILSPRKDFEALIIEKLKNELDAPKGKILQKENKVPEKGKKPFLKRGEGMTRFGIKKNDLVIQSTHDLPWKHKSSNKLVVEAKPNKSNKEGNVDVQILVTAPKAASNKENEISPKANKAPNNASQKSPVSKVAPKNKLQENDTKQTTTSSVDSSNCEIHAPKPVFMVPQITKDTRLQVPKGKHPLLNNKGKTWAAVFTKEQDDFLRQLKQSDYYKNFTSPAKSLASDISCDENLLRLRQDREIAEQNMFELLENKVDHESFNVDNSFVYRFLKGTNLESSGESTPLILQKCLANNPGLKMIFPETQRMRNETLQSDPETCNSECTECCNETCTSVSDCCSCNTVEETTNSERATSKSTKKTNFQQVKIGNKKKEVGKVTENEPDNDKTEDDTDIMKANLAEMNAKLIATSEVLKDRLVELEDEIETFRKENANLTKMREEIETEKHKFFEEKSAFEQKFNEEKILSEYYLAEEKEKLSKQKQIYDRQVREMRGRLNKKEKDEVINLKKEINDLKEEIRLKDAKSTTTVARLRNQLKIMEKEKKELQDEIEKLKKENRRIQHSNDISQRLTNMKYLEEVNKKLKNFNTKSAKSQVELDEKMKYKGIEMERQSRSKRIPPTAGKNPLRARAKSVPNLNVTSRYAKYFSQRDVLSPTERNQTINIDTCPSEDGDNHSAYEIESSNDTESIQDATDNENENSLEKIYMERFQDTSKENSQSEVIDRSSHRGSRPNIERSSNNEYSDGFFIRRSNSNSSSITNSKSPKQLSPHYQPSGSSSNRSKSPVSILSNKSSSSRRSPVSVIREHAKPDYLSTHARLNDSQSRSRSPVSILSNQTYSSRRQPTVITKSQLDNRLSVSPEPSSKTSLAKTDLKPMEIRKPDGSRELRFPNGNVKHLSADGKYSKFIYYNGDVKENFFNEGRIKYYYAETQTVHTTHPDGLEVLEFPDGQVEKRYPDNSSEIRLPNGSVRYYDPKNEHVREEWRFPDGATLTVAADGSRRVQFANGQVEVHTEDHKRREFPDGTVKLVYNDGTSETRYASGRVRIKDKHGNLIMDSVPG